MKNTICVCDKIVDTYKWGKIKDKKNHKMCIVFNAEHFFIEIRANIRLHRIEILISIVEFSAWIWNKYLTPGVQKYIMYKNLKTTGLVPTNFWQIHTLTIYQSRMEVADYTHLTMLISTKIFYIPSYELIFQSWIPWKNELRHTQDYNLTLFTLIVKSTIEVIWGLS